MPYAKVNDINIYYEIHGGGEPLVVLPGRGSSINIYEPFTTTLSKNFQVVAIDNRGSGKSDKPDIPYSYDMMAADVVGILNTVGIEKSHILGLSMGGNIAQHFTLNYPEKVINLILGCTTCGGSHNVAVQTTTEGVKPEERERSTPEEQIRGLITLSTSQTFVEDNPEYVEKLVSLFLSNPHNPIGIARQTEANATHDTYDRLPDIKVPTLIIAGEIDIVVNPENSRILASRIPNSELMIMEGMGHGFHLQAPDEFVRIILDFIKRHYQK